MVKVIQIRGVPDELHVKLVAAADEEGKSLTSFVNHELAEAMARRDSVAHNRRITEELRAEIGVIDLPEGETQRAIDEGRADRDRQFDEAFRSRGA